MIVYHVYQNDAAGGPIDLAAPAAVVSGTTWTSPALPPSADVSYLVRSFDTVANLEDQNGDARVTVAFDALGNPLGALPAAPTGLTATPRAAGSALVVWSYAAGGRGASTAPIGFHVYVGTPAASYAAPVAAVAFDPSNLARVYSAVLTGLAGGTTYRVGVRAFNAAGEEANAIVVPLAAVATGPGPVLGLTVAAVP